jgi:hypothetical protein
LSNCDKRVLCKNLKEKSSVGTLEITDKALIFESIKGDRKSISIPMDRITNVITLSAMYSYFASWTFYLHIYYKSEMGNKDSRTFMFQRGSGSYFHDVNNEILGKVDQRTRDFIKARENSPKIKPRKMTIEEKKVLAIRIFVASSIFLIFVLWARGRVDDIAFRMIYYGVLCLVLLILTKGITKKKVLDSEGEEQKR